MNFRAKNKLNLRETALKMFADVFSVIDAEKALVNAVNITKNRLYVCSEKIDLAGFSEIYVISLGKAALPMAFGLRKILKDKIKAGVISAPKSNHEFPPNWQVFSGGHPVPNQESLAAARASIEFLKKANHSKSLIFFLISGGGSAMLELPKDEKITLEDLQTTNKILVSCGAKINEINKFRRSISQIKGGGLSRIAPLARQVSLIISDTNSGDIESVASGPTVLSFNKESSTTEALEVVSKYHLQNLLPKSVIEFLHKPAKSEKLLDEIKSSIFVLLDNQTALEAVAKNAENRNFINEIAVDLVENSIEEGCRQLVKRLLRLREKHFGKTVAIISGGEFVCPVRGNGIGGRNLETVLRCLLETEKYSLQPIEFAILSGGTDGIDGNSSAAGAVADETSLQRAEKLGLDAKRFLANSDSFNFFHKLGDEIIIGASGTNIRDVRILLAR